MPIKMKAGIMKMRYKGSKKNMVHSLCYNYVKNSVELLNIDY